MDRATLFGLLLAFGGVAVGVALEGGHASAYISISSFLIVCVGSLGAMAIAFQWHEVRRFYYCTQLCFRGAGHDWEGAIKRMIEIATMARRNGVLSLEPTIAKENNEFIKVALRMMVDGADSEALADVLDSKLDAQHYQARQDEKMFEMLGGFMPTLGIVGTVTSLIHVLGNLSEPEKLGAGIAAAFTATLYGVGIANMAILPMAGKIRCIGREETEFYKMLQTGLVSVQSGDNPLWVEQKMRSFVPAHVEANAAAVTTKPKDKKGTDTKAAPAA